MASFKTPEGSEEISKNPQTESWVRQLRETLSACERYESSWQSGESPQIEQFLDSVSPATLRETVRQLLQQELRLRQVQGEHPRVEEYLSRLPGSEDLIREVFRDWIGAFSTVSGLADQPEGFLSDSAGLGHDTERSPEADETIAATSDQEEDPDDGDYQSKSKRFKRRRWLDQGGLGVVWVADDLELNREVVIKEIRPDVKATPDQIDRFVREAVITGQLEHPGVIPVYGLGRRPNGRPFYAMRLIRSSDEEGRGGSLQLDQAIRNYHSPGGAGHESTVRTLAMRRLLQSFVSICQTVAYAHSRKVIHRDIKPRNILLGPFGEVLVSDWGLARIHTDPAPPATDSEDGQTTPKLPDEVATTVTSKGDVMGTLAYMPPEQAAGEYHRLGPRSDVYSLGATLYEILTGKPPFRRDGREQETLRREVIQGKFPPPRQVNGAVPPPLEAVCLKAMSLDPEDRYPTAKLLAADVERWLADEPISVYRDPLHIRTLRWTRRHRPLVVGAATLLVAASVGLLLDSWYVARERDRADRSFELAQNSLGEMLGLIASDLGYLPGSEPIRQKMAEKAEGFYSQLIGLRSDDPAVGLDSANALLRLGNVFRTVGNETMARKCYQRSDELIARIPAGDTILEPRATTLAMSSVEKGELHRMRGRPERAIVEADQALTILAPFRSANSRDYRIATALALLNRSAANLDLGDAAGCRADGEQAIRLLESLGSNRGLELDKALIGANVNLASGLREAGDAAGAILLLEKCLANVEERRSAPAGENDPDLAYIKAMVLEELGLCHAKGDRPEQWRKAEDAFVESLRILQGLTDTTKDVDFYHRALGGLHERCGSIRLRLERPIDAAEDCSRAISILEPLRQATPEDVNLLLQLARAHFHFAIARTGQDNPDERAQSLEKASTHINESARLAPKRPDIAAMRERIQAEVLKPSP